MGFWCFFGPTGERLLPVESVPFFGPGFLPPGGPRKSLGKAAGYYLRTESAIFTNDKGHWGTPYGLCLPKKHGIFLGEKRCRESHTVKAFFGPFAKSSTGYRLIPFRIPEEDPMSMCILAASCQSWRTSMQLQCDQINAYIGTMIEVYLLENPTSPAKKTQVKWHIDDVQLNCNFTMRFG